jgi:hypothetical protein
MIKLRSERQFACDQHLKNICLRTAVETFLICAAFNFDALFVISAV